MRQCSQCKQEIYENEHFTYLCGEFYHTSYCLGLATQEHHRTSTQNAIQVAHELNDYEMYDENFGD